MKYTKEVLEAAAAESDSMAATMRQLGLTGISGGMHAYLKRRIKQFGIDTSHWTNKNKGKFVPRKTADEILVRRTGIYKEHTRRLLRAMLQAGVEYKCRNCGLQDWRGKFIRLHIEHKNGNNKDNRLSNLEFLCPNCHSQTSTYGVLMKDRTVDTTNSYMSLTEKLVKSIIK